MFVSPPRPSRWLFRFTSVTARLFITIRHGTFAHFAVFTVFFTFLADFIDRCKVCRQPPLLPMRCAASRCCSFRLPIVSPSPVSARLPVACASACFRSRSADARRQRFRQADRRHVIAVPFRHGVAFTSHAACSAFYRFVMFFVFSCLRLFLLHSILRVFAL